MKTIIVTGILFLLGCNGKNENDSGQLKQQITDADKAMSDLAAKDGFNNSILFYAETGIIKLGKAVCLLSVKMLLQHLMIRTKISKQFPEFR
jgi:hypothetical protein